MIRLDRARDLLRIGIPRESGDDPTAASILVTTGAYSPQEWG